VFGDDDTTPALTADDMTLLSLDPDLFLALAA